MFEIPINKLKMNAPSAAPEQNKGIGSKILGAIGNGATGAIGGLGKILGSGNVLASAGGIMNASQASSANQKRMGMADAGVDAIANAASAFGPVGSLVGTGMKLINSVGGNLINTPKSMKEFGVNEEISSGYGGVSAEAGDVQSDVNAFKSSGLAGKLSGRKRISNAAELSTAKQSAASEVTNQQNKIKGAVGNSMDLLAQNTANKMNRNIPGAAFLAKTGGAVPKFAKGGSVIVSGALHARKHNIDSSKGILKDVTITDKGVPLVLINKNGGEMIAEFEKEELVIRKDIIEEIDELREDFNESKSEEEKDEILNQIGVILTKEILSKTKDKDKLIDGIE